MMWCVREGPRLAYLLRSAAPECADLVRRIVLGRPAGSLVNRVIPSLSTSLSAGVALELLKGQVPRRMLAHEGKIIVDVDHVWEGKSRHVQLWLQYAQVDETD